jgi:hypothetical protein
MVKGHLIMSIYFLSLRTLHKVRGSTKEGVSFAVTKKESFPRRFNQLYYLALLVTYIPSFLVTCIADTFRTNTELLFSSR